MRMVINILIGSEMKSLLTSQNKSPNPLPSFFTTPSLDHTFKASGGSKQHPCNPQDLILDQSLPSSVEESLHNTDQILPRGPSTTTKTVCMSLRCGAGTLGEERESSLAKHAHGH